MITSYKKAKEDVLQYYSEFLDIVSKIDFPKDDTSLQALKSQAIKIKEDKFCLMIAGEAKSGKSTFINAYLGTEFYQWMFVNVQALLLKLNMAKNLSYMQLMRMEDLKK